MAREKIIDNIGFVEACRAGAKIIAKVDDDNIPYVNWGESVHVGKEIKCGCYETPDDVFDPLSVTNHNYLWHRGFPIDLIATRDRVVYSGKTCRKVPVQADLWDGDPDLDALARIPLKPEVKFSSTGPYCSSKISSFNSQNTFLHRDVTPFYSALPFVDLMDDIWGSYILQQVFGLCVIYNFPSVYQKRNIQSLTKNLCDEIFGYENTPNFVRSSCSLDLDFITPETKRYYEAYKSCFE